MSTTIARNPPATSSHLNGDSNTGSPQGNVVHHAESILPADGIKSDPLASEPPIVALAQIIAIPATPAGIKRSHSDSEPSKPSEDINTPAAATSKPTSPPAKKPHHSDANNAKKPRFIYGNYDRYYGYRNAPAAAQHHQPSGTEFADIRLEAFRAHAEQLFADADCLDIGCNCGAVSFAVASRLGARSMLGIDIDKSLIGRARQQLAAEKRKLAAKGSSGGADEQQQQQQLKQYPHNIYFKHGNYVLNDAALLALERPQFDTVLCLSITKWIHLHHGDAGLKLAFQRMHRQLRPGGRLVLEAQLWQSYKRRKRLTPTTERHFAEIRLRPDAFEAFLLGAEVGFVRCWRMEAPRAHAAAGFRRPLLVFEKAL